jgi:hypothetical protein
MDSETKKITLVMADGSRDALVQNIAAFDQGVIVSPFIFYTGENARHIYKVQTSLNCSELRALKCVVEARDIFV